MSAPADNDKSFERVLASFLREDRGPARQDCPRPGVLSAYFERRLAEAEALDLEVHLSQCSGCQAELAALVRLEPEPMAETGPAGSVAAPPLVAAPTEPSPEPETISPPARPAFDATRVRPRARGTLWRWVGPMALAASAVLAVSVTYRFAPLIGQASRGSGESGPGTRVPEDARQRTASRNARGEQAPETPHATLTAPAMTTSEGAPRISAETNTEASASPESEPREKTEAISPVPMEAASQMNAATTAPAPPAALDRSARPYGATESMQARKDEQQLEPGRWQRVEPLLAGPTGQEHPATLAEATQPGAAHAVVIVVHADPDVAWRVHDSSIERSEDGGKTWRAQLVGGATGLSVGSAPSATICWLAGRDGLVLRTTDGEHWQHLSPPTSSDLVEITARNASEATVRAAGGERFSTRDGGRSWSKL